MKNLKIILTIIILNFAGFTYADDDFIAEEIEENSTNEFVLDNDNSGGDVQLTFGENLAKYLKWDAAAANFELNDSLKILGNLEVTGELKDKDGDSGAVGQILSSSATGIDWITNSSNPIPFISSGGYSMPPSSTKIIVISGENFTPSTVASIPGFDGTVNSTTVNSSSELEISITAGTTETIYDIVISNGGVLNTIWAGNGVNLLTVATSNWIDLRAGGASFTDGNGAGNDIRYRSGMGMSRDSSGMYFTGSTPWSSWVKFESLGWTRGTNKTLQWIFTRPDAAMMIGIGSTTTDETSTAQYYQAEIEAYFSSATNFASFYGKSTNQSVSYNISGGSGVFKLVFEDDGDAGSTYTLYEIPSANQADWDNTSLVRKTGTITAGFAFSGTDIMPFIIPRNGGAQRFIAVKVD